MKPVRSGNRAISVQPKGDPLAIVMTTAQAPKEMMPAEISSESTLSMMAILPDFLSPGSKMNIASGDGFRPQTRIVFVPLKLSLSPMVRLAGGVEFPDPMTIDGLHHADLGEDHRPIVLRGVADAVRGGNGPSGRLRG
jgi:hypothetical protein